MFKESIARRYSTALFGLAKESNSLSTTTSELDAFVAALNSAAQLGEFFVSPVVDRTVKERIIHDTLSGRASELVINFLVLLVRKRRENLVEMIARQMHELLDIDAGRKTAAVATPMTLDATELTQLAQRLSKTYGGNVILQPKVAPDLLGGLIVQVGDRYVDDSVSGKLEELRRHLLAGADNWAETSPNGKGNL